MTWKPHVTVAVVVERDGRFLVVEEETEDGVRFNQPAGHLEAAESLVDAAVREAFEETACHVRPHSLIGIYRWGPSGKDLVYLRFAFAAEYLGEEAGRALDAGILRAVWMTPSELASTRERHRSPLVAQCIDDYRSGRRYDLELIRHYGN